MISQETIQRISDIADELIDKLDLETDDAKAVYTILYDMLGSDLTEYHMMANSYSEGEDDNESVSDEYEF